MQLIVNIIVLAAIYALLACGYVLIYRVSRVMNMAHGELAMLGAYLLYTTASLFVAHPVDAIAAAVVLSLKRKPIKTLQELVGARVGTGSVDAGAKIFPALLALNKVDMKAINRMTIDVKLRDTMLIKGEVDAVVGFDYTTIFNLIEAGLKLEDITLLYFADYGFDFWGNSLIVNPAVITKVSAYVDVETEGALTVGRTVVDRRGRMTAKPNALVALGADEPLFVRMLLETLGRTARGA